MNGTGKLDRIKISKPLVLGDSYATLRGDPKRRDEAGPLCELVSPRGPHVFRGMTLAHGSEPQFSVEWGDKQAHVSIDAVDSDWPLNKPRDLVGEIGELPSGSDLEIVKRVNTR